MSTILDIVKTPRQSYTLCAGSDCKSSQYRRIKSSPSKQSSHTVSTDSISDNSRLYDDSVNTATAALTGGQPINIDQYYQYDDENENIPIESMKTSDHALISVYNHIPDTYAAYDYHLVLACAFSVMILQAILIVRLTIDITQDWPIYATSTHAASLIFILMGFYATYWNTSRLLMWVCNKYNIYNNINYTDVLT